MRKIISAVIVAVVVSGTLIAQQESQKTLSATLGVYAFPQKGQSASDQSLAESQCYDWAVKNIGADPFQLQKQSQQVAQQSEQAKQQASAQASQGRGRTVVRGAAVGTLVGGISGNEGKGAAYGAAAGVIAGNRRSRQQSAQASASVDAQANQQQADIAAQTENFKKAFSVCLEGKGYMVKY